LTIQHQLFMYCDGPADSCPVQGEEAFGGDYSDATNGTRENYRRAAAREGWTTRGSKDYCPACSKLLALPNNQESPQ
jgi:hypothetical protein